MRCKKCGRVNTHSIRKTNMCWRTWRLCPKCAVEEHPERYVKSQISCRNSYEGVSFDKDGRIA